MTVELRHMRLRRQWLSSAKRIIIKIGSSVLAAEGKLRPRVIGRLAQDVADLRQRNYEVLLVVSGAVAAGFRSLGLTSPPAAVVERQAAASIGQYYLMGAIARAFQRRNMTVAQLLMMDDDIEDRRRFLSARHTLQLLIRAGIVPIINENDPLADDEQKIGDNDHLAVLVSSVVTADLLIILSTVPGLREGGNGSVVPLVEVGSQVEHHIRKSVSATGVGGMRAKVSAAKLASRWGVPTIIASGKSVNKGKSTLGAILDGEGIGTFFAPPMGTVSSRKRWIAVRSRSHGAVTVDAGARNAVMHRQASLLPAGVIDVEGNFPIGTRVDVRDETGKTFALGLVSYSADEIRRIRRKHQGDIRAILGYEYVPEVIDRDDLVIVPDDKLGGPNP